ncbi:hypothetical protein Sliba_75590 [Streptomyces nigrescens]|uniref:Aldehyde dehydrogenase domain-containing protein n=1 Tax=Streptomyces nigrescens TaxID=1920 RepID=A0A640TYV1_STRNI|nr:hypothetical protein Sliba_75590 [Streptomyces libani subsp. libani]GGV97042.1 hypothetical protein GCM10010500_41470 [Streptomyces libani subsp. libani]
MVRELTHFIGGKHAPGTSGLFADVHDPNTGLVQARVPPAGRADTERAIADAELAQQEWGEWNPQRRARVLLIRCESCRRRQDAHRARSRPLSGERSPAGACRRRRR